MSRSPAKPEVPPPSKASASIDVLGWCFFCGKKLHSKAKHWRAYTADGQRVSVGLECFSKAVGAGEEGYQPPQGGPKIYAERPNAALKRHAER